VPAHLRVADDAAGRSLEEIGDHVGHSSAYMTDKYRHLVEGQREEAAEALAAYRAARTGAQTGAHARRGIAGTIG
jgi:hypothetical protein